MCMLPESHGGKRYICSLSKVDSIKISDPTPSLAALASYAAIWTTIQSRALLFFVVTPGPILRPCQTSHEPVSCSARSRVHHPLSLYADVEFRTKLEDLQRHPPCSRDKLKPTRQAAPISLG